MIEQEEIFKDYDGESKEILKMGAQKLIESYLRANNSKKLMYEFTLANNPEYAKRLKPLMTEASFEDAYKNWQRKSGIIDFDSENQTKKKVLENLALAIEGEEKFFLNHLNDNNLDTYQFVWETINVLSKFKNSYFQRLRKFNYFDRENIREILFMKNPPVEQKDKNQLSLFQ